MVNDLTVSRTNGQRNMAGDQSTDNSWMADWLTNTTVARTEGIIPAITTPPVDTTPPVQGPQLPDPNAVDIPILPTESTPVVQTETVPARETTGSQMAYSRESLLGFITAAAASSAELTALINDALKLSGAIDLKDENAATLPGTAGEEATITRLLGTTISLLAGAEETLTAMAAATSSNTEINTSNTNTLFRQKEFLENFVDKFDRLDDIGASDDRVLFASFATRMRTLSTNIKAHFSSNTSFYQNLNTAVLNQYETYYADQEDGVRAALTGLNSVTNLDSINSSDTAARNAYLANYQQLSRFIENTDRMASAVGASSKSYYSEASELATNIKTALATKQPITNKMYEDRETEYKDYFLSPNAGHSNIMERIDAVFTSKLTTNPAIRASSLNIANGRGNTYQRYYNYATSFISKAYKLEQMIANVGNIDAAFTPEIVARIKTQKTELETLINQNRNYYALIPSFDFDG